MAHLIHSTESSQELEYDRVQQHYGDSHSDMDGKCADSLHGSFSLVFVVLRCTNCNNLKVDFFFFCNQKILLSGKNRLFIPLRSNPM